MIGEENHKLTRFIHAYPIMSIIHRSVQIKEKGHDNKVVKGKKDV